MARITNPRQRFHCPSFVTPLPLVCNEGLMVVCFQQTYKLPLPLVPIAIEE